MGSFADWSSREEDIAWAGLMPEGYVDETSTAFASGEFGIAHDFRFIETIPARPSWKIPRKIPPLKRFWQ